MMVFCQSRSVKLRIIHADGNVCTLHYTNKAERDRDRQWYEAHGFMCK
jgi:hypothetical protein